MDIFHRRQQPAGHGFPRYHDGDVFITITRTYMYQLHARTLRRWSSIFKRLLIDNTPVGLPRKRKCDHGPVRYRIDFTSGGGDWAGSFVRRVRVFQLPFPHKASGLIETLASAPRF